MSTPGERIRDMRLRLNLTLDDVAKYLGIGRQAVYKYEHGTVTNIPLDKIEQMAELFGTTPGYLSCWSDNPNTSVPLNLRLFGPQNQPDPDISAVVEMMQSMSKAQKQQAVELIRVISRSKE